MSEFLKTFSLLHAARSLASCLRCALASLIAVWRIARCAMGWALAVTSLLALVNLAQTSFSRIQPGDLLNGKEIDMDGNPTCHLREIPSLWRAYAVDASYNANYEKIELDYNAERVAAAFSPFAALSANAYRPWNSTEAQSFKGFDIHALLNAEGYSLFRRYGEEPMPSWTQGFDAQGFLLQPSGDGRPWRAILAFRGTDGLLGWDMLSNLSYIFYAANPHDQYKQAREEFKAFREWAAVEAKGAQGKANLEYFVTGHSLGGGLAKHVAAGFPCVTAVVFNASFVTNESKFARNFVTPEPTPQANRNQLRASRIISLFEDEDFLSWAGMHFDPSTFYANNPGRVWYRMKTGKIKAQLDVLRNIRLEHSIDKLSAAMLRMPLDCFKSNLKCEIMKHWDSTLAFTSWRDWPVRSAFDVVDINVVHARWCNAAKQLSSDDKLCAGP